MWLLSSPCRCLLPLMFVFAKGLWTGDLPWLPKVGPLPTFMGNREKTRISSVVRALDCRAEDCEFDSWDWNNTQGLKITKI